MSKVKRMSVWVIGMVVFGFAGSASAYTVTIDLEDIQHLFSDMKMKTMGELYSAKPLKDQMRGKMMLERASNNFMQYIIQPQMMQRNRDQNKPQQMGRILTDQN